MLLGVKIHFGIKEFYCKHNELSQQNPEQKKRKENLLYIIKSVRLLFYFERNSPVINQLIFQKKVIANGKGHLLLG